MNHARKAFILNVLGRNKTMSFATVHGDGYPQATVVAYANDGLSIYFCCDRTSQKVRNLRRSRKVSLTINRDYKDWHRIKGLSMAATATVLSKPDEIKHAFQLLARKLPDMRGMSEEDIADSAFIKVAPRVISVLDYSKGFGHTDLIRV